MPGPPAFTGSRLTFLQSNCLLYAEAVASHTTHDFQANLFRRYSKRYPITLLHNTEPSDAALEAVDDDEIDEEEDISAFDEEQLLERKNAIIARQNQINRWFKYQYKKTNAGDSNTITKITQQTILERLLGVSSKPPRKVPAIDIFAGANQATLGPEFDRAINGKPHAQHMKIRAQVKTANWDLLDGLQKERYKVLAETAHSDALEEHQKQSEAPWSTLAADRSRAIQALPAFLQPLLDQMSLATGLKMYINYGGPDPLRGGEIGMTSMYSTVTPSDPYRKDFSGHCGAMYGTVIVPSFIKYLLKCFSPEECKARALTEDEIHQQSSSMTNVQHIFHKDGEQQQSTPVPFTGSTSPLHEISSQLPLPLPPPATVVRSASVSPPPSPVISVSLIVAATQGFPVDQSPERQVPNPTPPYSRSGTITPPRELSAPAFEHNLLGFQPIDQVPKRQSSNPTPPYSNSRTVTPAHESSVQTFGHDLIPFDGTEYYNPYGFVPGLSTTTADLVHSSSDGFSFADTFVDIVGGSTKGNAPTDLTEKGARKRKLVSKQGVTNDATMAPVGKKSKQQSSLFGPSTAPRSLPLMDNSAQQALPPLQLLHAESLSLPPAYIPKWRLVGDEPAWAANAVNELSAKDLGPEWSRLVDAWFERESLAHWVDSAGRIGLKHGPEYLALWIRSQHTTRPSTTVSTSTLLAQIIEWYDGAERSRNGNIRSITGVHGAYVFLDALFLAGARIASEEQDLRSKECWAGCVSRMTAAIVDITSKMLP